MVALLDAVRQNRNISKEKKTVVKTIITYSSEVWLLKEATKKKTKVKGNGFLAQSRRDIKKRMKNIYESVRETIGITHTIMNIYILIHTSGNRCKYKSCSNFSRILYIFLPNR